MSTYSGLRLFVFLSIVLLFVGGAADAQVVSLVVGGDIGPDFVYEIGDSVAVVFAAVIDDGPVAGIELVISHSGLGNVSVSNGGVTNALGIVTVEGVFTSPGHAFIRADWDSESLTARANFDVRGQEGSLKIVKIFGIGPDGVGYVGDEITVIFRASPADQVPLYVSAENITVYAISAKIAEESWAEPILPSNYTTDRWGELAVRGVLTEPGHAFVRVHWDRPHPAGDLAASAEFDVRVPLPPAILEIVSENNQHGDSGTSLQPFVVVVKDKNDKPLPGVDVVFRVIRGEGSLSATRARTDSAGQAETALTLGSETGIYQVEASVVGYPSLRQTFTAAATTIESGPPKATTLSIVSGYGQEGETRTPLDNPFVVEVRDQYGDAFSNATVSFRVTRGGGLLSSAAALTDNSGRAPTTLTLGSSPGMNVVEVTLAGIALSPKVFFTATAIAPPEPEPVVPEPTVYWIEDGAIWYLPTGGERTKLLEPHGATLIGSLVVDMEVERIYWTEQTSHNSGRIGSAALDGTDIRKRRLNSVPYGVAVGTDGNWRRWVYWTNSRGKIQRIKSWNFWSGRIEDVIIGDSPKHIAYDAEQGQLYWSEASRIRRVFPGGRGKKEIVIETLTELTGIAAAAGVVYWTERTGDAFGKVRSVNSNGSGVKLHAVLESVPEGIAVGPVGGRLYWTTSRGEIQSAPIAGGIETVVTVAGKANGVALGATSETSVGAAPSRVAVSVEEGALLANYPNPFNPETWIPYNLAEAADVTVSIYAVDGSLVRTLDLGHQAGGVYQSKSRAAYWDGRNAFGERVASGLYFYTLTAGDFTATRKMLIRK